MYTLTVRDHIMIAHSLPDEFFGPASNLHGATFIVDAGFSKHSLDEHNVVLDIGFAQTALKTVLNTLNFQNTDDMPQFKGKLTTTEYLAFYIHTVLSRYLEGHFTGELKITLHESHVAWASYSGQVNRSV